MHDLIGRNFSLNDCLYAIVDVRNIGAETMVYAEPSPSAPESLTSSARAAFHFTDIEALLEPVAQAS